MRIHSPYVEAATQHGLFGGYDDGSFRPGNAFTRAQIAKVLYVDFIANKICAPQ